MVGVGKEIVVNPVKKAPTQVVPKKPINFPLQKNAVKIQAPIKNPILTGLMFDEPKPTKKYIVPKQANTILDESGEFPDISDEYIFSYDSDDSENECGDATPKPSKGALRADWADTPGLRGALQKQHLVDPDDIFGNVMPVALGGPIRFNLEIFNNRQKKASRMSAWTGNDCLSMKEKDDYRRNMGYKD